MITPSLGLTATERVLPRLALDFTTASLDSRVTFARALNTATRINSSGAIEIVNADTPRFDYDPIALVCKGLLIEESRTNIIVQSAFASGWTFNASGSFGATTTAPDNGTAQVLTDSSASASAQVYQLVPFVSGTVYTFSFYIKAVNRTLGQVVSFTQAGTFTFDLSGSGSVGTPSGVFTNPSITAFNNGWFRISVTLTATATASGNLGFSTNSNAFTGNAWALWGAQLEVGAFPTSYIPTEATAVTRNADVATMTGVGSVDQGTFTVDATYVNGSTLITSGGVSFDATASTAQKTSVGYDATSIKRSINAGAVSSDAGATAGADIAFGTGGVIRELSLYSIKMIDAELQAFSK